MQKPKYDGDYFKGLVTSNLDQRYTRDAEQNSDADMLIRNVKLGVYTAAGLAVLVALFLVSNGLI